MSELIDMKPVSFITVGTVGPPGERVFYLQAGRDRRLVSLIIEKEHAQALAIAIQRLLSSLGDEGTEAGEMTTILDPKMALVEPVTPEWRVGQLGLGYDEEQDLLIVVAQELVPEESEAEPSAARFWATRQQTRALSHHALRVCAAGRPTCVLCGRPLDPRGHFCPGRNGHAPPWE